MPVLRSEAGPRAPPGLRHGNRFPAGSTALSQPSMPAQTNYPPRPPADCHAVARPGIRFAAAARTRAHRVSRDRLCWRASRWEAGMRACRAGRSDRPAAQAEDRPVCPAVVGAPGLQAVGVVVHPGPELVASLTIGLPRAGSRARVGCRAVAGVATGGRPAIPAAGRWRAGRVDWPVAPVRFRWVA